MLSVDCFRLKQLIYETGKIIEPDNILGMNDKQYCVHG